MKRRFKDGLPVVLVLLSPTLTEWLESGHLPREPRELFTDVVITLILGFVIFLLYRKQRQLVQLSEVDSLTGLKNKRKFHIDLAIEVDRAQRMGTALLLAFIDVDRFKSVNDRFGHQRGDQLLNDIAHLLERSVRTQIDVCYRLGGDEFAVLMPIKEAEHISDVQRRIFALEKEAEKELGLLGSGLSIGLTALQADESSDALLLRADQAMYDRKKGGGKSSFLSAV